jgi:amidophosphoribosyltransferase
MPSRVELVAHNRDNAAIAEEIGADLVIFQTLEDLVASVRQFNPALTALDCSVFTGEYVTGGVDEHYLAHIERLRADNVKTKGVTGSLGAVEGKGGGATVVNGHHAPAQEATEAPVGCSGPLNGADDTIGKLSHDSELESELTLPRRFI